MGPVYYIGLDVHRLIVQEDDQRQQRCDPLPRSNSRHTL